MMLDHELSAKFSNHSIFEVSPIVGDDSFGDAIPTDEVTLNEHGHNILGDGGK